jgi:dipeptidyl aminopeptidase/acylaminoacyl peptidase
VLREDDTVYAHTFSAPALSPDGKQVLYLAESSHESHDLWVSDLTFRDQRRVTTINPQLSQYKFGQSRIIEYKTAEGRALRASVLLPTDYKAGKRYPTMVWVYAGDDQSTRYVNNFGLVPIAAFNMQMLATRGYAVIWPEVPTSRGTPMKDLMKAVMPAIDKLVELGIADGDRLAVMGNSNGGYSTLALIAQTNRFKAAVCNSGFGDLGAFYGTMGGGWIPWLERLGGGMGVPPWEAPMQYVENSPYYQLNRIQTPLMLQAGAADLGIINHSDAVWVGMQRLNKDVTYLRYGGESHVLAAAANLNDYWKRLFAFFDKHLQAKKTAK